MRVDPAIPNAILLVDDGEFDDVRSALCEFGFSVFRP